MMYTDAEYLLRSRKIKQIVEYSCESFRRDYDLKQIEIDVLAFLAMHPDTTGCMIANSLDLHKGQLSSALNHLVKMNYVSEYHDPSDHRYVHYQITDKSKPLIQSILCDKQKLKQQMFRGFTEEEMDELCRLLTKMTRNIDQVINQN